mmetsp:Transcript_13904/g.33587  ORF Transcript_13904/g.33587 Transcript_13904/m.33587 type:complete len:192 (+) Transcript_13904:88-663(+)
MKGGLVWFALTLVSLASGETNQRVNVLSRDEPKVTVGPEGVQSDALGPTPEQKKEQEQKQRAAERRAWMRRCVRGGTPVFAPSGAMTTKQLRKMFSGECTAKSECMQKTGSAPFDLHGAILEFCKNGHAGRDLILPHSLEDGQVFYTEEFCAVMARRRHEIAERRKALRESRGEDSTANVTVVTGSNETKF